MADAEPKFKFQPLSGKKFPSFEGKEENELYLKWSLKGRMICQTFSFDQQFQPYQKDDFILAFFKDPQVRQNLKVVSPSGNWHCLGGKVSSVEAETLGTSQISLTFFDRLEENNIVRASGNILKCYDDFFEEMLIANELRKMLVMEDSDNYSVFDEEDRKELLFLVFRFLVMGGAVCQFDDDIGDYLDLTKKIYKDLVSVQRDPATSELRIISTAYSVTAKDENDRPIYPTDKELPHTQDFAYLIVDPLKRHATVFYHNFGASIS